MKANLMKQALAAGRVSFGHMISEFATRGMAKILETTGIDFTVIDMEHTGHDIERIADLVAWFKAVPIPVFVRVPEPQYHFIARILDAGALGVMVPNVESAEEARAVVSAVKYAPLGSRGVGLAVAQTDYLMPPDPAEFFREANATTTVICQIESTKGLENLDSIAAVEGVDVLWVGHYDLTLSMGIPAQFQHQRFLDAMRRVSDAAKAHGLAAAIQPGDMKSAIQWLDLGFNVISWCSDSGLYRRCLTAEIAELRARV